MAREKLTQEERKRRTQERNRLYWEAHREEIALKRKIKREQAKAEKQARAKQYQEQARQFLAEVEADEALQKQIPQKPIEAEEQNIRYVTTYVCPRCKNKFTGMISKYCYHCGQALDWSDDREV